MADNLLVAQQVRKEFGGLVAVNDVDFVIPRKAIVGPDRAERCRQDDVLQHAHGRLQADRRRDRVRRQRHHREAPPPDHEARRGADLPEHPPLRVHDRARERPGRHAPPAQGRHPRLDLQAPARPARGEGVGRDRTGAPAPSAGSRAARTRSRATSPTATSAVSRWRGRSPRIRSSSCWTSRPPA